VTLAGGARANGKIISASKERTVTALSFTASVRSPGGKIPECPVCLPSSILHRRRHQEDSPRLSNSEVEQLSRVSSCLNNLVRGPYIFQSPWQHVTDRKLPQHRLYFNDHIFCIIHSSALELLPSSRSSNSLVHGISLLQLRYPKLKYSLPTNMTGHFILGRQKYNVE
jgi:hypothetical protein